MVSRTESKLKKVQSELNPKVKSKLIVADFSENASINFYRSIMKQCDDLNIRFLVVNAGILHADDIEVSELKPL